MAYLIHPAEHKLRLASALFTHQQKVLSLDLA
jgi:hypothetical protein